jgi:hypothetical protein
LKARLSFADKTAMIWNFAKGRQRMTCESREAMLWYELVVTSADGVARVERYTERAQLLRRQHELLCAWKAQGWEEVEPQPAPVASAARR